jgi:putative transposase
MNLGFAIDRKRIGRLMAEMGIEAIYPKPKLSRSLKEHVKYPYLLKGVDIERVNQVWGTDITYIPTLKGHVYLVAIMDWHSRYVVSWELSNSMESFFCIAALKRAFRKYGYPEIFNSDQGSQFTGEEFQQTLQLSGQVRVSMDGRGRCMDNIFTERLWRSVKYEEVYTGEYENLLQAREGLSKYLKFYNEVRLHQALEYRTPAEVYFAQEKGERRLL